MASSPTIKIEPVEDGVELKNQPEHEQLPAPVTAADTVVEQPPRKKFDTRKAVKIVGLVLALGLIACVIALAVKLDQTEKRYKELADKYRIVSGQAPAKVEARHHDSALTANDITAIITHEATIRTTIQVFVTETLSESTSAAATSTESSLVASTTPEPTFEVLPAPTSIDVSVAPVTSDVLDTASDYVSTTTVTITVATATYTSVVATTTTTATVTTDDGADATSFILPDPYSHETTSAVDAIASSSALCSCPVVTVTVCAPPVFTPVEPTSSLAIETSIASGPVSSSSAVPVFETSGVLPIGGSLASTAPADAPCTASHPPVTSSSIIPAPVSTSTPEIISTSSVAPVASQVNRTTSETYYLTQTVTISRARGNTTSTTTVPLATGTGVTSLLLTGTGTAFGTGVSISTATPLFRNVTTLTVHGSSPTAFALGAHAIKTTFVTNAAAASVAAAGATHFFAVAGMALLAVFLI